MRYKILAAVVWTAAISGAFFQWQGEIIGEMRAQPEKVEAVSPVQRQIEHVMALAGLREAQRLSEDK